MSAANPYFHSVVGTTIQLGNIRRRTWVIFDSDGNMFRPLIEYFIEKGVGLMTQRHIAMAVGLYIDYMVANGATYSQRNNKSAFLSDFAWAIQHGTVHSTEDHTGLYWKSRTSVQARKILNSVCEFLDWLLEAGGLPATDLYRASTLSEKMAYWRYFNTKKQASLLNHIKFYSHAMKDAETTRRASIRRVSTGRDVRPPRFPEDKIFNLLFEGFVKPGKLNDDRLWVKYDLRNILITILLHGGGLRVSEPFHIYCHDVISDPYDSGQCVVRVYHPSDGLIKDVDTITGKPVDKTRSQYLQDRFDLRPRHEIFGREHAGWKDLFLDEARSQFYINVHWFPRYWGVLFRSFYALYVKHVLPVNMKHPYAFICTGKRYFGKPYTIASFREAHKGAVLKIGLEYKKEYGTTPHGHRHAYGQNLKASGVRERHIQACMHHRSPLSQLVYTEPTYREIDAILSSTSQKVPNYRTIQEKLGKHFNVSIEELLRELVR